MSPIHRKHRLEAVGENEASGDWQSVEVCAPVGVDPNLTRRAFERGAQVRAGARISSCASVDTYERRRSKLAVCVHAYMVALTKPDDVADMRRAMCEDELGVALHSCRDQQPVPRLKKVQPNRGAQREPTTHRETWVLLDDFLLAQPKVRQPC